MPHHFTAETPVICGRIHVRKDSRIVHLYAAQAGWIAAHQVPEDQTPLELLKYPAGKEERMPPLVTMAGDDDPVRLFGVGIPQSRHSNRLYQWIVAESNNNSACCCRQGSAADPH